MNDRNSTSRRPSERPVGSNPPRRPLTEAEKLEIMKRRRAEAARNATVGQARTAPTGDSRPRPRPDERRQAGDRPRPTEAQGKPRRPEGRKRRAPEPPPRRRNEESYNFSRSLSETHERIMAERRERLEDARVFRREDARQKMHFAVIAFCAVLALVIAISSVVVSCTLSGARVKKSKGEYVFTVGSRVTNAAYSDAVRDGVIYISMNEIAELCGMTVGGSTSELRFTVPSGDWVSFSPGSRTAKINGYGMEMPAPARMKDTTCHIPLEFLELILEGIDVKVDESKNRVTVTRQEYSDSTPLEPHYLDVFFMLKADIPLSSLDENKYFSGQPLFTFKNDLSEYESYMNPTGDRANAYLMLLNKQFPLEDYSYEPDTLIEITEGVPKSYWLESNAQKALEAMMLEMKSAGFTDVYVTSGYRSYNYQSILFNRYLEYETTHLSTDAYAVLGEDYIESVYKANGIGGLSYEDAVKVISTYSAEPGYSEHHTGLCVDFITNDMGELNNEFADKEIFDWLCANAWKFGYTLRYPEDKVDVTGYSYESWHWRFVGRTHALEMLRSGECFEEYLTRTGLMPTNE